MIDPIGFIINETVKTVRDYIKKAEQSRVNTVERCENYLEAARHAINGLVATYDEILVKAENCELDDHEQVNELREIIRRYANVDRIRPELRQAIKGISNCHDQIYKIAGQSIQLPNNKKQREEVVTKVRRLLKKLATQLSRLESHGLQHLPAGTGIGIRSLDRIMAYIDGYQFQQSKHESQDLSKLINQIREERVKDELWIVTDQIVDTINDLYSTFR